MAKSVTHEFVKGLWAEIPPFRLVLGLCPTLGVTTKMQFGIGMGLATTFVLVCANILVSMLRKAIPSKVRIACFIIIIATFVILVELLMQAYTYPLYQQLGIFIPLIVVNCIVLGRAEAFASKNSVSRSILDGLGMGVGFTFALLCLGCVREIFGSGSLFGLPLFPAGFQPWIVMILPSGGFFTLGLWLLLFNRLKARQLQRQEATP